MGNALMRFLIPTLLIAVSSSLFASSLDEEDVLALVQRGVILPLREILNMNPEISKHRLLDLELEHEDEGVFIYEIEVLSKSRVVIEFEVDAVTGRLLQESFEE